MNTIGSPVNVRRMGDRFEWLSDWEIDTTTLLTTVLGIALVLSIVVVAGFALAPTATGDTYTEFYVLGPNGTAADYPENVTVGEPVDVRVGIGNHESRQMRYTLVVRTNETTLLTRAVTVDVEEQWEESISFSFDSPGQKRLRLELYVGETRNEPYRSLRLFVDVTAR